MYIGITNITTYESRQLWIVGKTFKMIFYSYV